MKRLRYGWLILSSLFLLTACVDNDDEVIEPNNLNIETWTIASKELDCTGITPQKCLVYKEKGSNEWKLLYNPIQNFEYEPGYEYTIQVALEEWENPPTDASSITYSLVKEVLKSEKESRNLPE